LLRGEKLGSGKPRCKAPLHCPGHLLVAGGSPEVGTGIGSNSLANVGGISATFLAFSVFLHHQPSGNSVTICSKIDFPILQ
jgi:hypothetical protein